MLLETIVGGLLLLTAWQWLVLRRMERRRHHRQPSVSAPPHYATAAPRRGPARIMLASLGRIEQQLRMMDAPTTQQRMPYQQVRRLAREGADAQTLVVRCGVSPDEARLIVQLYTVKP